MTKLEYDGLQWEVDYGITFIDKKGEHQYDYNAIIERLHPDIKRWVWVEEGSYQGEFYGLGIDEDGYYCFVSGSFGSCSGCDWLQSVSTIDGAIEFLKHYKKVVIRKQYCSEMKEYLEAELVNAFWKEGIKKLIPKLEELHSYTEKAKKDE